MSDGKAAAQGSPFEALLGELATMTKALPAGDGDAAIAAAAGDTGGKGGKKAGGDTVGDKGDKGKNGKISGEDDPELDADGKPIMKALTVQIDGKNVEALDGTALIKSLMDTCEVLSKKVDESENIVAKALGTAVTLIKAQGEKIANQANLIKALQENVGEIGNEGRGRKTLLSIIDKPGILAKAEDGAMTGAEFFAKANQAFDKKMITGKDLTIIDVSMRQNQAIDPGLVQKVLSATA